MYRSNNLSHSNVGADDTGEIIKLFLKPLIYLESIWRSAVEEEAAVALAEDGHVAQRSPAADVQAPGHRVYLQYNNS